MSRTDGFIERSDVKAMEETWKEIPGFDGRS